MTLSSSTDTDNFSGSPSLLRKVVNMDDDESNYVNIQYFLNHTKSKNQLDRERSLETFVESDDEVVAEKNTKTPHNKSGSLGSNKSQDRDVNGIFFWNS